MKIKFNPLTGGFDLVSVETPGGDDTQVQFNDDGEFGGDSGFTFNKATGNVGIGATSAITKFRVAGGAAFGTGIQNDFLAGADFQIQTNSGDSAILGMWQNGVASSIIGNKSSDSNFYITNNYYNGGIGVEDKSIAITRTGEVGIGTKSPGSKLEIVQLTDELNSGIKLANSNITSYTRWWTDVNNKSRFDVGGTSQFDLIVNEGGVGNFGVGIFPTAAVTIKAGTSTVAPLKLMDGALLTTPAAGAIEYTNNKFYITNVNTQRAIDRTSDVLLETVEAANTTTETTLYTALIPANSAMVGNVLKAEAHGLISSALPTDFCTIRLKLGGTTIATLINPGKTLDGECWDITAVGTIRSVGTSGQVAIKVKMELEEGVTSVCSIQTVDTTTAENLTVTAEWNNAKTGNTILVGQGFMEYKN